MATASDSEDYHADDDQWEDISVKTTDGSANISAPCTNNDDKSTDDNHDIKTAGYLLNFHFQNVI